MTDQEILEAVIAIIARHARVSADTLSAGTRIDGLLIGSLDMVQVLFDIEETFEIYVAEDGRDMKALTIGDLCVQIRQLRAATRPTA
jgi:acyl carrier protein